MYCQMFLSVLTNSLIKEVFTSRTSSLFLIDENYFIFHCRDERPPTVSTLGAATSGDTRRWIPPSVKRDALTLETKHHANFRKYGPG